MSKTHGMGDGLYVGGYDLSGDIGNLSRIACPRSVLDVTDITQSAPERLLALKDGGIDFTAYFNPAVGRAHPVLSALPTTDTLVTYRHGSTVGNPAASMVGKQLNYDATRNQDGSLTFAVNAVSNAYGLEWGRLATAGIRSDSSATNGTGYDWGGATSFGLQMYVHLLAFTGTSVTIKLQESSDNAAGDAYADVTGATTGALTAIGWTRVQTGRALAVEQWLRVVTTGTFSAAQFVVVVVRNANTVNF